MIVPMLPFGETRRTYTACDSFYVSSTEAGCPLHLNKRLLLCFVDLPQQCAATLLGMHKSSLVHVRQKFGMEFWPYVPVMHGQWNEMSKEQIVLHRESVIADFQVLSEREDETQAFECRHAALFLRILRAAVVKADMFWKVSGRVKLVGGQSLVEALEDDASKGRRGTYRKNASKAGKAVKAKAAKIKHAHSSEDRNAESATSSSVAQIPVMQKTVMWTPVTQMQVVPQMPVVSASVDLPEQSEETMSVFWPLITEQFNFDPLFEVDGVEDVLRLGPIGSN